MKQFLILIFVLALLLEPALASDPTPLLEFLYIGGAVVAVIVAIVLRKVLKSRPDD